MCIGNIELVGIFRHDICVRLGVFRYGKNSVKLLRIEDIKLSEFDLINSPSTPLCVSIAN